MHNSVFIIGVGTMETSVVSRMFKKPVDGELRGNTVYGKDAAHITIAGDVADTHRCARITIEGHDWTSIRAEIEGTYTTAQDGKISVYKSARGGNLFPHIDDIKSSYPDATIIIVHSQANTDKVLAKVQQNEQLGYMEKSRIAETLDSIAAYVQDMQPTVLDFNTEVDYILPTGEYVCNCVDETEIKKNIEYYVV